jgi:AcrR family transcriptional regulator
MFNESVQSGGDVSVRSSQRQDTHARVLAAARRQFLERGFADTTVRAIAADAGVSVGTVMVVGDKQALLVRVFDTLIEELHHRPGRTGAVMPGENADATVADRILDLLTPFVELFTSQPDLARAYAVILVQGQSTSTVFTALAELLLAEINQVLHQGGPPGDPAPLARAVYLAYLGTLFTWPRQRDHDVAAVRASLRATVAAICRPEAVAP